jgi:hypothetical protein
MGYKSIDRYKMEIMLGEEEGTDIETFKYS